MTDNGKTLWTVDDVAARVGMHRQWVYAETRADRIPHLRLGRYFRYRPEAIEAWLAEMERGQSPNVRAKDGR